MAWKNLKQRSLAEAMLIDHDALKELDAVHELIDWSRLEQQLSSIHPKKQSEKAEPLYDVQSPSPACKAGTSSVTLR